MAARRRAPSGAMGRRVRLLGWGTATGCSRGAPRAWRSRPTTSNGSCLRSHRLGARPTRCGRNALPRGDTRSSNRRANNGRGSEAAVRVRGLERRQRRIGHGTQRLRCRGKGARSLQGAGSGGLPVEAAHGWLWQAQHDRRGSTEAPRVWHGDGCARRWATKCCTRTRNRAGAPPPFPRVWHLPRCVHRSLVPSFSMPKCTGRLRCCWRPLPRPGPGSHPGISARPLQHSGGRPWRER